MKHVTRSGRPVLTDKVKYLTLPSVSFICSFTQPRSEPSFSCLNLIHMILELEETLRVTQCNLTFHRWETKTDRKQGTLVWSSRCKSFAHKHTLSKTKHKGKEKTPLEVTISLSKVELSVGESKFFTCTGMYFYKYFQIASFILQLVI